MGACLKTTTQRKGIIAATRRARSSIGVGSRRRLARLRQVIFHFHLRIHADCCKRRNRIRRVQRRARPRCSARRAHATGHGQFLISLYV
jgi:hypothetical protein